MQRSESISELAAALAKAQAQVKPALKDSTNPFFKSKYADFSSVLDACKDALADNGLAVIQAPITDDHGAGVETMILHSSGEWISERLTLPVSKEDAQGVGSAITYARRYALEGFLRIEREDDDGNAAARAAEALRKKALDILIPATEGGLAKLEAAWKTISNDMRAVCKNDLEGLKRDARNSDAKHQKEMAHANGD